MHPPGCDAALEADAPPWSGAEGRDIYCSWRREIWGPCPGDLHCPGIIIPSAFAADFLLFQLWSSHPSDPGVQRGRQWVSYTCAAKCTTAPGQFLHAVGMVQRGAHGCNCLTRAGQGEPSTPHVPAQLSSIASATKWHILPPSPGEKEDIQWVFEVSWC